MLDLEFAELSDRGLIRQHNEDFIGHVLPTSPSQVHSQGWLFAIADGVGGQDAGEVAARMAIETVIDGFRRIPKGVMHASLLPRLIQEANATVFLAGNKRQKHGSRMATTLVACALRFDSAVISHVGDSRCYLFRNNVGKTLTHDHTMAEEQFRLGILSQAEASVGENRHILTRSLGNEQYVAADTITVNVIPGDLILLARMVCTLRFPMKISCAWCMASQTLTLWLPHSFALQMMPVAMITLACKSFALARWNKWVFIEVGRIGCYKWSQPQRSVQETCWTTIRSRKSLQRAAWPRYSAPSTR